MTPMAPSQAYARIFREVRAIVDLFPAQRPLVAQQVARAALMSVETRREAAETAYRLADELACELADDTAGGAI